MLKQKNMGGIILRPYCSNNCVFCVFCGTTSKVSEKELKIQEIKALKNIHHLRKKGYRQLEISGNDPLDYDKIIPLIKYIKKQGFDFIRLSTHGLKFADENFLREFVKSGINEVNIPLYGSKAEIHDSVTRNKGSFEKILKGIKQLKKTDIKVRLSSLLLEHNKDDLINILKLMKEIKADRISFSIPCLSNTFNLFHYIFFTFNLSYYIPFKDQRKFLVNLDKFAEINNFNISFTEIPYCVFGYFAKHIDNQSSPPDLGKYNQPDNRLRTPAKDLPKYRLKRKEHICRDCSVADKCDGFFVRDVERYGIGNLQPIRQ
jgi:MoaA/NifB/PqqE/SkfB family radical SAM enzyme